MSSNNSKTIFLESPDSGDDFRYLYYSEKIQLDDFKRIFSKKHVKKRSGPVFGPFRGGYLWDVSIVFFYLSFFFGKNLCIKWSKTQKYSFMLQKGVKNKI